MKKSSENTGLTARIVNRLKIPSDRSASTPIWTPDYPRKNKEIQGANHL